MDREMEMQANYTVELEIDDPYNGDACGEETDVIYIMKSRWMSDIMEMHADRLPMRTI